MQARIGLFVDEQTSKIIEGKGGKLGDPRGRLGQSKISAVLTLNLRLCGQHPQVLAGEVGGQTANMNKESCGLKNYFVKIPKTTTLG